MSCREIFKKILSQSLALERFLSVNTKIHEHTVGENQMGTKFSKT